MYELVCTDTKSAIKWAGSIGYFLAGFLHILHEITPIKVEPYVSVLHHEKQDLLTSNQLATMGLRS